LRVSDHVISPILSAFYSLPHPHIRLLAVALVARCCNVISTVAVICLTKPNANRPKTFRVKN